MLMDACSSGDVAAVLSILAAAATEDDNNESESGVVEHEVNINAKGGSSCCSSNYVDENNQLSRAQLVAAQQDQITGISPLMVASQHGHIDICRALLDAGAPWNAVDRRGKCAGDYATDMQHWDVVNLLVDVGTKAEVR
jgi:protein arginine N-methyltransferase 2